MQLYILGLVGPAHGSKDVFQDPLRVVLGLVEQLAFPQVRVDGAKDPVDVGPVEVGDGIGLANLWVAL